MTDHTPEELAKYYKGALERIIRVSPSWIIEAFETNEGRNCNKIIAGPPPKPKWTNGAIIANKDGGSCDIDFSSEGVTMHGKIVIYGAGRRKLRDEIIDFLNKWEEELE